MNFPHHTSWPVDDIDAVSRGAYATPRAAPSGTPGAWAAITRGSNFSWYLKAPATSRPR